MAYTYYHDTFDNSVVDLSVDSPNGRGTVSESTTLLIQANSGQDCDWWYTVSRRGALAYVPLPSLSKITKWYCEIDVAAINCPGNSYAYLCCLIYDGTRHVWMGCQGTGASYSFAYNYWNGSDANLGSFSTTLPVKLRLVWDKGANTVQGYYWGPSQTDWTSAGSALALPWTPVWFGAGCKNWSPFPTGNANLSLMDVSYDSQIGYKRDLRDLTSRSNDDATAEASEGLVDSNVLRTLSGLQRHTQPHVGQGYVFNERNSAQSGGPAAPAVGGAGHGAKDSYVWRTLSAPSQHDQPQVGSGYVLNERGGTSGAPAVPAVGSGFHGLVDRYLVHLQDEDYQKGMVDSESHAYFNGYDLKCIRFVDNTHEPWNSPTSNNFTGYARDGTKYTNGVQDAGPVWAPWASEVASSVRSSRADFPVRAALISTNSELVILDLDNYPAVKMWMRFNLASAGNWYMVGGVDRYPLDIRMWNGELFVVGAYSGSAQVTWVNFKATAAPVAYLLDGTCYVWTTGKTIVDRNAWNFTTTGAPTALRLPTTPYRQIDVQHDGTYLWVALATDTGPYVIRGWDLLIGPQGNLNGACPAVAFDRVQAQHGTSWAAGVLFYAINSTIYRNRLAYKNGKLITETTANRSARSIRWQTYDRVDLGYGIVVRQLAVGGPYLYAATNQGIFRIRQGTLAAELLYSVKSSAGGMGSFKILSGESQNAPGLRTFTIGAGTFLAVGRPAVGQLGGEIAIIRDKDNKLLRSYRYPDIWQDGSGVLGMLTY